MTPSPLERLLADAPRFSFVALVHALESLSSHRVRVGGQGPFQAEAVHFSHDPALVFHATDVTRATRAAAANTDQHVEVTTTFLGLTGSASPMPSYFVEELLRAEDQSAIQREFLDVFHHRLLGLLYRGLLKFDAPRSFASGSDRISERTLMLCGLSPERTERITALSRNTLLRLSPLLVAYPPTPQRLSAALSDVLHDLLESAQVEVVTFTGGSVAIKHSERPRLGLDLQLGMNSVLGGSVRAPASAVSVRVGPLTPEACRQLSPGGARHDQLCGVVALLVPPTLAVSVELSPTRSVPARLGPAHALRLGRDTWLGSRGVPAKLRFRLPSHASA